MNYPVKRGPNVCCYTAQYSERMPVAYDEPLERFSEIFHLESLIIGTSSKLGWYLRPVAHKYVAENCRPSSSSRGNSVFGSSWNITRVQNTTISIVFPLRIQLHIFNRRIRDWVVQSYGLEFSSGRRREIPAGIITFTASYAFNTSPITTTPTTKPKWNQATKGTKGADRTDNAIRSMLLLRSSHIQLHIPPRYTTSRHETGPMNEGTADASRTTLSSGTRDAETFDSENGGLGWYHY
ncbi:hypothetical protein BDP27DRAFT_1401055 [Rhodocollybia butyracea]|uniref:Uncharacterized protein n=1 Tax=Rhodocollybia butyracea TaxID=206335 RepID=A0A9P5Q0Y2_9AGAR|nr:hypothetical protein BDP27DRAFT_1401055 [Rhodocollybia butyracea]